MSQSNSFPRRTDLLDQMQRANRFAWALLFFELILIAVVAVIIDWGWVIREPLITAVAVAAMACPLLSSLAIHWATKKKRIEDLKETTPFWGVRQVFASKAF